MRCPGCEVHLEAETVERMMASHNDFLGIEAARMEGYVAGMMKLRSAVLASWSDKDLVAYRGAAGAVSRIWRHWLGVSA